MEAEENLLRLNYWADVEISALNGHLTATEFTFATKF